MPPGMNRFNSRYHPIRKTTNETRKRQEFDLTILEARKPIKPIKPKYHENT